MTKGERALHEALERLRQGYLDLVSVPDNKGADFHFVLTVERPVMVYLTNANPDQSQVREASDAIVTSEMEDAGLDVWYACDLEWDSPSQIVRRVFQAMLAVR